MQGLPRSLLLGPAALGRRCPLSLALPSGPRAVASRAPRHTRPLVQVSQDRLDQFLKAELAYLSQGGFSSFTLQRVLENSTPEQASKLIQKELPKCFATRIRQIEDLTPEWRTLPGMQEIQGILMQSFRNLRLVDLNTSDPSQFTELIRDLRERHRPMVGLFAKAARSLKESGVVDDHRIDEWLGTVMKSRIGTEMLTAHYMSLLTDPDENHIGIVDTKCDPARICSEAISIVQTQFEKSGVNISLRVEQPDIEFSFISKYLFFVVEELLKNSASATLSWASKCGERPRGIDVLVCEDPRRIGIKISDEGGGVPMGHTDKIWEFMFSTTPGERMSQSEATPLSGSGMGLPLCRLYTQYLGGSLHLMSMPGVGTDVYMYLNRIEPVGASTETPAPTPTA